MSNILEVSGLCKKYSGFALQDVSFSLPSNCIAGFIGRNGAGKTTTIRNILGFAKKDAGNIKFFGLDFEKYEAEIKKRIGVVLDEGCFYDELTIADMKSIIAAPYSSWDDRTFNGYLERFSLAPKKRIKDLSKGMKMKYSLALALSHDAELLIMDEPTGGLDPIVRKELLDILQNYINSGAGQKSVLFSTHITSDLDKIADLLVMIDNGKIVFQKSKDELLRTFVKVRGNKAALTEEIRKLVHVLDENDLEFVGITAHAEVLRERNLALKETVPTVEDIMFSSIEGSL